MFNIWWFFNTFFHENIHIGVTKTKQTGILQTKALYAKTLQTKTQWSFNFVRALSLGFTHLKNEWSTYVTNPSIKACETLHMRQRHSTSRQCTIIQTLQIDSFFIAINCRQKQIEQGRLVHFSFKCKKGVNKVLVERVKNALNKLTTHTWKVVPKTY